MFKTSKLTHPRGPTSLRVDHIGKATRSATNFAVQAAAQFNKLPEDLKSPTITIKGFKCLLKEQVKYMHLLTVHNNN